MTYRDETDALRAENQALKDELAALKGQATAAKPAYDRNANAGGAAVGGVIAVVVGAIGLAVGAFAMVRTPARSHREYTAPVRVAAEWQATVQSVVGDALAPGARCVVSASVDVRGAAGTLPSEVAVSCGDRVLYSAREARSNGGSMFTSGEARLVARGPGPRTFDIHYEERGAELRAYPRLTLDSRAGVAVISRDGANPMRVQLRVDRESGPTQ